MNAEMIAALRELEREKGIAFETILTGLAEAMASAYKTWWKQENPDADDDFVGFRAEIDPESGDLRMWKQELEEIEVPAVEEGAEPTLEMKVLGEAGGRGHRRLQGSYRRADRQAGDLPEAARRRARDDLRGVRRSRGRRRDGHRAAAGASLHLAGPGQGRGLAAAGRTGAVRALPSRRTAEGVHHRGPQGHEGPADRRVPFAPRPAEVAVRDGGARDRRGHRRDPGRGA